MEGSEVSAVPVLATLLFGVLIGYLGQRSGACSVSGIRDLYLVKDTYLIKGNLGMFIGALAGYLILQRLIGGLPRFPFLLKSPGLDLGLVMGLVMIGGLGMGFYSTLMEGCPFRQHVRAAEGSKTAIAYLAGFYLGIIYFNIVVFDIIIQMLSLIG